MLFKRRNWTNLIDDSCIKCVWDNVAILSTRVVDLEYSQLNKKAYNFVVDFEGFENVLRDTGICAIPIKCLPTYI